MARAESLQMYFGVLNGRLQCHQERRVVNKTRMWPTNYSVVAGRPLYCLARTIALQTTEGDYTIDVSVYCFCETLTRNCRVVLRQ